MDVVWTMVSAHIQKGTLVDVSLAMVWADI